MRSRRLPPTLVFHLGKLLVVLFQGLPKLLIFRFNIVQALYFELELLAKVQSRHGVCNRGSYTSVTPL